MDQDRKKKDIKKRRTQTGQTNTIIMKIDTFIAANSAAARFTAPASSGKP
jgi:hypothetical protein